MKSYGEMVQQWNLRSRRPILTNLELDDRGLLLGAETTISKFVKSPGSMPTLDIDGREDQILALLSVAHKRSIPLETLDLLRYASNAYRRGEKALAQVKLASTQLPKLHNPEQAAFRLFMADYLIGAGISPTLLLKRLDIDGTSVRFLKASPDDPKHPGWPKGTPGGLGGKFRTTNHATALSDLHVPHPISDIDFSDGFHDVVVDAWMEMFRKNGIPAVKEPRLKVVGPYTKDIGAIDILIHSPGKPVEGIEVKTGINPTLTRNQSAYIPMLQLGGHIYSVDPRIANLGLVPGVPFPPMQVWAIWTLGSGQPYRIRPFPLPEFEP